MSQETKLRKESSPFRIFAMMKILNLKIMIENGLKVAIVIKTHSCRAKAITLALVEQLL
jgi:hypothetical protein